MSPDDLAAADWQAIGTGIRVVVTDPGRLDAACGLVRAQLAELDAAASRFRPDSELMGLPPGETVQVSPLLADLLGVALLAAARTDGDLDPTLGLPMADLGYDRDFALVAADGPAVAVRVRPRHGWQRVQFDPERRTVCLPASLRLDLGATAKAWAADRAARRVARDLECGALVSFGGDIAVAGPPPTDGWRIRVQDVTGHPDDPAPPGSAVVVLGGGGLATSSTTARRWQRGGRLLHHILDPRTALPAAPVWRTVSVAALSCLDANIAATTAVIRGERAPAWLAEAGAPARLVGVDGTVRTVGGWPQAAAA